METGDGTVDMETVERRIMSDVVKLKTPNAYPVASRYLSE